MQTFRLTADAKDDLVETRRYTLNKWGMPQTQAYLTELRSAFHVLGQSPHRPYQSGCCARRVEFPECQPRHLLPDL